MATSKIVTDKLTDNNGYVYEQEIQLSKEEFIKIQQAIKTEIHHEYPRKEEYTASCTVYLDTLELVGVNENIAFMNLTTTRFINLYLELELEDTNTYIEVI